MSRFASGNRRSQHSSLSLRCHTSCNSSGCCSSCLRIFCWQTPQAPVLLLEVLGTETKSQASVVHVSPYLWSYQYQGLQLRALNCVGWAIFCYYRFWDATSVTVSGAAQVFELSSLTDGDSATPDLSACSVTGAVSSRFNRFYRVIFSKDRCGCSAVFSIFVGYF